MECSFKSGDCLGLVLGEKDRENNGGENNNFASLDLHPIFLPLITDDFQSHRDVRLRLTGIRKSFCPSIILS